MSDTAERTSTAARAVALLHEDYHAGKVCFITDPAECAGHQGAHDITQLLVNAGLLAWGEADTPRGALPGSQEPSRKLIHAAVIHDGLWTPKCANVPGWSAPLARESGQVNCLACIGLIVTERLREPDSSAEARR